MADFKLNPNSHRDASAHKKRVTSKIEMVTESGCWIWMGKLRNGYGRLYLDHARYTAHRFAYEAFRGKIPQGLTLDHICRVTCCVNPWHLEPVEHAENVRRGLSPSIFRQTIIAEKKARTHCPQGHPYSPENTRIYYGCRYCVSCHRERQAKKRKGNQKITASAQ